MSKKISLALHALAFIAGNGAIIAFVPQHFQELATLIANFIIGLSAFYDKSHAQSA